MVLEVATAYLLQGKILEALLDVMTNYPLQDIGLIWIIFGGIVYAVWYGKTQDFTAPSIMLAIYTFLVASFMTSFVWIVFVLVLALNFGIMVYRLIKD